MFSVKQINDSLGAPEYLQLSSLEDNTHAKIYLKDGASMQELTLMGHRLIENMDPFKYHETYASSILFPFANRVKDGKYKFNHKVYQLEVNEQDLSNALHGMVYDKTFQIIQVSTSERTAKVMLGYQEKNLNKGFPYTYNVFVEYILGIKSLNVRIEVKNTSLVSFPFTIGWHPYFLSQDLKKSQVMFDCNQKIELNERNITIGQSYFNNNNGLKIGEEFLDDCYILESRTILFLTPTYTMQLKTTEENSFLQLYTPSSKNTIAIEPTTGVPDSLNNGMGLKTLTPSETYEIEWQLELYN